MGAEARVSAQKSHEGTADTWGRQGALPNLEVFQGGFKDDIAGGKWEQERVGERLGRR